MAKFAEGDGLFHHREDIITVIKAIAEKYCSEEEMVYVGIKGAFKEYLVATDEKVYIYKTGYMTGNTFGSSIFQLDYNSISAIQIHKQFGDSGYIEIIGIGMQNRRNISYWGTDKVNSASHQENCLSFSGAEVYEVVVAKVNELMRIAKYKNLAIDNTTTLNKFDEIKQYKELLDMGIITEEEFLNKKDELLNS